jgi:hypothetical protein
VRVINEHLTENRRLKWTQWSRKKKWIQIDVMADCGQTAEEALDRLRQKEKTVECEDHTDSAQNIEGSN